MADVRVFSYIFVMFLLFQVIVAKPMFGLLWCALTCDDDSTNPDDYDDFCECGPQPRNRPGDLNFAIPPSMNGLNFTMSKTRGVWNMNMLPWNRTLTQAPVALQIAQRPVDLPMAQRPIDLRITG